MNTESMNTEIAIDGTEVISQPILTWKGRKIADMEHEELLELIAQMHATMTKAIALNGQAMEKIKAQAELLAKMGMGARIYTGH